MDGRSAHAPQMFTTATLMCVVWLSALTLLMQQAQLTELAGMRAAALSSHTLASLPMLQR